MKTSKKIILTIAGLFIAFFIFSLIVLREDLQSMLLENDLKHKYKTFDVGDFEGLDFSTGWKVKIIQGEKYKLEISMKEDSTLQPALENNRGILYLKSDTTKQEKYPGSIVARITLPSLKSLKAVTGTTVLMENFKSDTLNVVLENGGTFTGKNNRFKQLTFKTSGDARLEFIDTQEQ